MDSLGLTKVYLAGKKAAMSAMLYHKVRKYPLEKIETLRDRCLYIFGEQDPFIKGFGVDYVKNTMEQLKMNVLWFDDAGHGINHESAEEVNSAIIEFLK